MNVQRLRNIAVYFLDPYSLISAEATAEFLSFLRKWYDIPSTVKDSDYPTFSKYTMQLLEDTWHLKDVNGF